MLSGAIFAALFMPLLLVFLRIALKAEVTAFPEAAAAEVVATTVEELGEATEAGNVVACLRSPFCSRLARSLLVSGWGRLLNARLGKIVAPEGS